MNISMSTFNAMSSFLIETGFFISLLINAFLFIPQARAIYKTKNSEGVSITTFFGFNIIQGFNILHAYHVKDWLFFFGMLASFITCALVTCLAFWYRKT